MLCASLLRSFPFRFLVTAVGLVLALGLPASRAEAAAPGLLGVQGALLTSGGGPVADGSYTLTFALYGSANAQLPFWQEIQLGVPTKNGRFDATVGGMDPSKLLPVDKFATEPQVWLGVRVGTEPELPRVRLIATPYALEAAHAATAGALSSAVSTDQIGAGAVTPDKIAFTYAGSATKGGPAFAAASVECTGCIGSKQLGIDGDVDLGGYSFTNGKDAMFTGTVTAGTYIGDGSKLSGIKMPSGSCPEGQSLIGVKADGSLDCAVVPIDPTALPNWGIAQISNKQVTNQFTYVNEGKKAIPIPDYNLAGAIDTITVPNNLGLAQKFTVSVSITKQYSGIEKDFTLKLTDPNNKEYVLHDKTSSLTGMTLTTTYPEPTKPISGDLSTWINENPGGGTNGGKWTLVAIDNSFDGGGGKADGAINSWSINVQVVSNSQVEVTGGLIVDGLLTGKGGMTISGSVNFTGQAVFSSTNPIKFDVTGGGAPFDVGTNSKKVSNLNADQVDGYSENHFGGLTYTVYGNTTCDSGKTPLYTGATSSIFRYQNSYYSNAASAPFCLEQTGNSFSGAWGQGMVAKTNGGGNNSYVSNYNTPCAVCPGAVLTRWGSESCPSGWDQLYKGSIATIHSCWWCGTWGGSGGPLCVADGVSWTGGNWDGNTLIYSSNGTGNSGAYQSNAGRCSLCYKK